MSVKAIKHRITPMRLTWGLLSETIINRIGRINLVSNDYKGILNEFSNAINKAFITEKSRLINHNDKFYFYNNTHYQEVSIKTLDTFVTSFCEAAGYPQKEAAFPKFSERLVEHLSKKVRFLNDNDNIKKEFVLINLENCTLSIDLKTGNYTEKPHSPQDYLFSCLPYRFDTAAECNRFDAELNYLLPTKSSQQLIYEFFGSVFISSSFMKLEKMLLFHGSGNNGKSFVLNIFRELLGGDKEILSIGIVDLCEKDTNRWNLENKRLNIDEELSPLKQREINILAKIISGEPLQIKAMYENPITITEYAKVAAAANTIPDNYINSPKMLRRLLIIRFAVIIPEDKINTSLHREISETEQSGIFNHVLNGLLRVIKRGGYSKCPEADKYLKMIANDVDYVQLWLDDCSITQSDTHHYPTREVHKHFKSYCENEGYKPYNSSEFTARLRDKGFDINTKSCHINFNNNDSNTTQI